MMTEQDKEYLRDLFAGFALCGMLSENGGGAKHNKDLAEFAYYLADEMMGARNKEKDYAEEGITAIKKRRKKEDLL
jgi:hypothetical protein